MVLRQHRHHAVAINPLLYKAASFCLRQRTRESHVICPHSKASNCSPGNCSKLDADGWVPGPVGINQSRQKKRCCPANAADGQSAGCALRRSASVGSRFLNSIENVFSLAKENLSCGRKSNRAFRPDEQFYFQLSLERSDLLTDSRVVPECIVIDLLF
jgi:hypothetical protein